MQDEATQQEETQQEVTRPGLPLIALAMLAGVCLLHLQPELYGPVWTSVELVLFLPVCLWLFYHLPQRRLLIAFIMAYLWALLFAHYYLQHRLPDELHGQDILLQGVVSGIPDHSDSSVRFDFQVSAYLKNNPALPPAMPSRLRLSWYYSPQTIRAGDHWQFRVRLKTPHGMQNPGGFDYEKWLYQQGIHATGYIRKSSDNQLMSQSSFSMNGLRQNLQQLITQIPDPTYAGLLQALTVGHKSAIDLAQWQVLTSTGTSHLMAISGLHIGLVAGLVFFLMSRLAPVFLFKYATATQIGAVCSLLVAAFYALLAGFTVPTQRAFIMLLVVLLALLLKRPAFSLNTLALALMAVLLMDPVAVLSVGFWLSFLAVLTISLLTSARIGRQKSWLQGIRIQWFIAWGMLPLSVLLFQQASLISPLANMLMIPLVGLLIVPVALLGSVFSVISTDISLWLLTQASHLLALAWWFLSWLAQTPFASWQQAQIPLLPGVLALLGSVLLLLPRGFPMYWAGLFMLAPMFLYQPEKPAQGEFWLTVLDVGQGLSVLVQTRDKTLLYDAGGSMSERFDMGQRVVLPYLNYIGVKQLDSLVISHGDNDHAGGANSVLEQMPVKQLLSGVSDPDNRFIRVARPCLAGQSWQWNEVQFVMLHPQTSNQKSNNRSCVLQITSQHYSLLLTGDIEAKAEQQMLQAGSEFWFADGSADGAEKSPESMLDTLVDTGVDTGVENGVGDKRPDRHFTVLLVPHHGSNTSSSSEFLAAVKPELAIVSAGYKNRFGHPTAKVLERYRQQGSEVLNTAFEGAIQIKFSQSVKERMPRIHQQRKLAVHYWNHRL